MSADRDLFPLRNADPVKVAAVRRAVVKLEKGVTLLPHCSYRVSLQQTVGWLRKELDAADATPAPRAEAKP